MSRTFLRIMLVALFVLLVQGTWALAGTTGSISGKVTDQSGNGVAGAKVTAASPGQTISVTSGANGFYSILNLSPDTYTVSASKDGYDTSSIYGITVTSDQTTGSDIKLTQTVKTIGHITTTATASVVSKTVTGDLYSVNAAAIGKSNGAAGGAETLYSQNSAVGSLPGVVRYAVGGGPGYGAQGSLSLRGGSPDQVGYELDGVPLNRGFDFYNGTAFTTNGLASLQVYTGGAPADEGRAMSGFINEGIQRGKYPGGADLTAVAGAPLYNHTVLADVYGSTPDQRFTYYISTLASNSYVNFGDRSNLANTSFTVPAGDPGYGAFNAIETSTYGFPSLDCTKSYVLNQPVSNGAFSSANFAAGRDTATNLHWSFGHNGLNDDLQALYVVGSTLSGPFGPYGTVGADLSVQSQLLGVGGVFPDAQNRPTWPTGAFYQGQVGQPYNPSLVTPLTYPSSGGSVVGNALTGFSGGVIPPTYQDTQVTQYAIEKLAYTRSLTQSSFLRLTGYKMYSLWSNDQELQPFSGDSFYQLHDNLSGVTLDYQNQINQQNLIKLTGDWARDLTLRYNYFNYASSGGAPADCVVAGVRQAPCTTPGAPVTRVGAPLSNWSTVTPLDWDGVISDKWKPSDKLLFDLGLRWDEMGFQLMPMKISGPDGIAYLAEQLNGQCLNGFAYSASDPRIIGPTGNQNCNDIITAAAANPGNDVIQDAYENVSGNPFAAKDAVGAAAWQDVTGKLAYFYLSPRFGATWNVDPRDVIRLSVGRYVQPPNSAYEQYRDNPLFGPGRTARRLNQFYNGLNFLAVHNVLPQDSTNYDLSIEHEFTGGVSVKITPYYRNTRNQVLNIPFNPQSPSFVTGDNFGNSRIKGVEFLLVKNVTSENGIGGTLSATYTDTKIRFARAPGGTSFIDLVNGTGLNGQCVGSGICGYNAAYHTNFPLLDPTGYYSPSFVMSPTAIGPSYDVKFVVNLTLDARTAGFDFVPTFNYQSGNPYGDPLNFPDAHCAPGAPVPGCVPVPAGSTFYGATGPDPYTGRFDSIGELKGPSWWTLNMAVSHDIGHNLKASILGTNLLAGIHNHGYPWEQGTSQQNISYADGFYNDLPQGVASATVPTPLTAYYGNNYYPYTSGSILPLRDFIFSVSAKI
ncbi:MAG TPA: carboxypeptidase regulatory-like domain-containing protein [Candidatus Acidoferrales bacterium]|nr:carboxypeptidase regulatory-like domain-containing protein [Candidatus Acidoferrales bacterium]